MKISVYALSMAVLFFSQLASADTVPSWLVGNWKLVSDEDHTGMSDSIQFRADSMWRNYAPTCNFSMGKYVLIKEDVVMLVELKKGPTALVFRPNTDHTTLSFTSPRTNNNSTYERIKSMPCAN